ncbi:ras guanine nucleotide exchange factor domain-containing protein [Cantharellus anzutake]|uniref:ras guanine nucleotide exchange factor domain-containing protein n=1 Tax=Cantharellus anzutake TaxID=1750568 RepID=UPI0019065785|nr:ras guanine nucleotide exchange factor domain-containing protein [Cantharellus anzutake]KAF8333089.1 ras guanine nucleotide exchange factor domain-containing protein [Cantharellus anzutake]
MNPTSRINVPKVNGKPPVEPQIDLDNSPSGQLYPDDEYPAGPSAGDVGRTHNSQNNGSMSPVSYTSSSSQYSYSASPVSFQPQSAPATVYSHLHNPASVPFRTAHNRLLSRQQSPVTVTPPGPTSSSQPPAHTRSHSDAQPAQQVATPNRSGTLAPIPSPTTNLSMTWGDQNLPRPTPNIFFVPRSTSSASARPSLRSNATTNGTSTPVRRLQQPTLRDIDPTVSPKRWYLEPSYFPDELVKDQNGNITAGTLEALVEHLTEDVLSKSLEAKFRETFFATCRTFADTKSVLDLLCGAYESLEPREPSDEPRELSDAEFREWRDCKLRPVQCRVLRVLAYWVTEKNMVEIEGEEQVKQLKDFLTCIRVPSPNTEDARKLLELIQARAPEQPISPSSISPTTRRRNRAIPLLRKAVKGDLLKCDAVDIAQQLTLMQYSMYQKILPQELASWSKCQDWGKPTKYTRNLVRFVQFSTRLQTLVTYAVLNTEQLSKRRDMKCRQLGNFHAVFAITEGLRAECLEKLHLTWSHVDKGQRLEQLKQLVRPTKGWASLRAAHDAIGKTKPCVPFIQLYLDVIKEMEDSDFHPDTVPSKIPATMLINFNKRQLVREWCDDALRFQNRKFQPEIEENPELMQFIEEQMDAADSCPDEWFTEKARIVRGGEDDHSDIRYVTFALLVFIREEPHGAKASFAMVLVAI